MANKIRSVGEVANKIGAIVGACYTQKARKWGDVRIDIETVISQRDQQLLDAVCGVLDGISQQIYNDISFQELHAKGNHGKGMVDAYINTLGFTKDAKTTIKNLLDVNK